MSKFGSLKIAMELKARFDRFKDSLGLTQDEALAYLLDLNDKSVPKTVDLSDIDAEKGKRAIGKDEKLRLFINMIIKHNIAEKQNGTGNYIFLPSAYFVNVETGMHKSRDIAPFLASMQDTLDSHFKKLGIAVGHNKNPLFSERDEKGRIVYIGKLMEKEGINILFGR